MIKSLSIAAFAAMLTLVTAGVSSAIDPPGGQPSSQLNSLDSRSGSPSEAGKTGIGSTSGSDAAIDTGLKATTQPCVTPDARTGMDPNMKTDRTPGMDPNMKSEQNTGKKSAADAAREAMSNVKKPDSSVSSDTTLNPDARSSAETSARLGTSSNPCPESRP